MPAPPTAVRHPIYCTCCGNTIVAERVEDAIVIKVKRNGRVHVAVVPLMHKKGEKEPLGMSGEVKEKL